MPQESAKPQSKKASAKRKTTSKKKSKGLGDTVEKITEATGIKKVVEAVVGDDCGCNKRKEILNKLVPYKTLSDEQLVKWEALQPAIKRRVLNGQERHNLIDLYNELHERGFDRDPGRCSSCYNKMIERLTAIHERTCQ